MNLIMLETDGLPNTLMYNYLFNAWNNQHLGAER